jgi:hypothetical protein
MVAFLILNVSKSVYVVSKKIFVKSRLFLQNEAQRIGLYAGCELVTKLRNPSADNPYTA